MSNETPLPAAIDPMLESDAPGQRRVSKRFLAALVFLTMSQSVASVGLVLVSWPITIAALAPDHKALFLSVITGLYALVVVIGVPVTGILSDRCTSRFGMRRPFIAVGAGISIVGLLLMAYAHDIGALLVGALIQAVGNAVVAGGTAALVPDQVPAATRGRAQGLITISLAISGLIASILLPAFIGNQVMLFAVPAAFKLVAALLVIALLRDRVLRPEDRPTGPAFRGFLAQFKVSPRAIPDYSWAWIGKVVVVLGSVLTTTYGVYYLTDHLKVGPGALPGLLSLGGVLGLLTAITGAALGSWISDRFRIRKNLVLVATVLIFLGAMVVAFAPGVPYYFVGLLIMGLGTGAYGPVDGALFIDVLPGSGRESGKYMSLMTVADQIPRSFGPILGSAVVALGALTALGGYPTVYMVGGVIALVGGLLVRKVRGSM
ncbi:MFS transporter [Microbacterium sp. NPDC056044]|uniref:MFS transporter n=1 Tax=Microbacterium sp. NPDC056044 TaxID=3345690 RepID=UPI0035DC1764